MSTKSSVFIATSLDGYIARTDGNIDWLDRANGSVPKGEDCGYNDFIKSVDVLIMGRKTFEKVLSFDEWPYHAKSVVVLSRGQIHIPISISGSTSISSEHPRVLVERLAKDGAKHLYIDGGLVIQSFLREGLIDEITIALIPVLLGSGKPLFGTLDKDIELTHVVTKAYDFGFVQNKYRIEKTLNPLALADTISS
ncbi:Dihydrofolate reductase [Tumidithrix helvetica PCC 7403]|uniref:dihydrofolate reductase family protein n=1 Tax=Tumidithrix helvetica TaxID=3457545 RepID=UPI003C8846D8